MNLWEKNGYSGNKSDNGSFSIVLKTSIQINLFSVANILAVVGHLQFQIFVAKVWNLRRKSHVAEK